MADTGALDRRGGGGPEATFCTAENSTPFRHF